MNTIANRTGQQELPMAFN